MLEFIFCICSISSQRSGTFRQHLSTPAKGPSCSKLILPVSVRRNPISCQLSSYILHRLHLIYPKMQAFRRQALSGLQRTSRSRTYASVSAEYKKTNCT
jgi:hypothetical protein